ncbi:MBL fold metallo-hydrolase [Planctomonas sp. JC2975]|uniref:MBL fold metallo-hydrolase n=1 Tax=Planctomonas sp. JC2975 TaxID=2729626 RepID=UPI00147471FD|nr:MBL fold metallo-hydrolase [Planctomonas sp. JC2975]NNC13659.1 MBL fold metallo-hydrolase [Planctomonas sp. JC2975]
MTATRPNSSAGGAPDISARGRLFPSLLTVAGAMADVMTGAIRPHRQTLARSSGAAGLPAARETVTLTAFRQVRREVATPTVADGLRHPARVGNAMTSFLVRHPDANILVDPAICDDVHHRVLPQLPAPLRALVAPPASVASTQSSLRDAGLSFADIEFALPTHLHWDHVSGLVDAPEIPIRVTEREWRWAMAGVLAPAGVARRALVGREVDYYDLDGPPLLGFARSHDLFGDGSVTVLDMSGHTPGSVGFLLHLDDGRGTGRPHWALLVGDAAWHTVQVTNVRGKGLARAFDSDRSGALEVIRTLSELDESIAIVPSHDAEAAVRFFPSAN